MRRLIYELNEAFRIAFTQIIANKLRSALTALGVIIGIVSVTLMGTAILGIDASVEKSFAGFGDDVLYVEKWPWRGVQDWWNYRNRPMIKTEYAERVNEWVAEHPNGLIKLAVPAANRQTNIVRGELKLSNIFTEGVGHNLPRMAKMDLTEGRFFSEFEAHSARNVVVIGYDVADALFPGQSPLGETLRLGGQQFTVIGTLARQGRFLGLFSLDSKVMIPINTFRRYFAVNGNSTQIRVQVDGARMEEAREELRGLIRRIRQQNPEAKDNFELNEQRVIREQIDPIKNGIAIGGLMITGLALLVGAINIMNITYVSVKERTKEIGTRKALGARRRTILLQFLIEAVSICLIGGAIGLLGAGSLSALVSVAVPDFPIVFSPVLVVIGFLGSVVIGVLAGIAPAWSASKLDPVVALRYE
ncbi:ABC transporter [Nibricoccus aquaticus]|uniref:ABC transporter n=1 Tax=Nibricoccus aquaticus TaxID=2576891 RepID=A0A290Q3J0_9BACT|nr:ABC transporter permease [Nibricoccus aquaticus]ATC63235.1 ABC transporter [Nibricoccus aquaticus]